MAERGRWSAWIHCFAVGRTTFWDALKGWREQGLARDAAVQQIADNYKTWVDIFETAQ